MAFVWAVDVITSLFVEHDDVLYTASKSLTVKRKDDAEKIFGRNNVC